MRTLLFVLHLVFVNGQQYVSLPFAIKPADLLTDTTAVVIADEVPPSAFPELEDYTRCKVASVFSSRFCVDWYMKLVAGWIFTEKLETPIGENAITGIPI
ncbi:hypothetical protein Y032_0054g2446 [Ancylostoma ceylanicum]|uniref:Uncharacterized protein n=1 Tax=Ancylostoma ceylanicum TaxID=53326 RepID=A0A016U627_9BILA|nr:hypothetical protein Y032_0054g2446 [Ancylostoma ceylanicum]